MKKQLSLLLCVLFVLSAFALTGCGENKQDLSDSKYVGTWKAARLALKDESEELEYEWILTLNGDGTGQFVGEEDTSDIKWELTSDGFKTTGDVKLKFKDDGDNIKANVFGVDLIFEKQ